MHTDPNHLYENSILLNIIIHVCQQIPVKSTDNICALFPLIVPPTKGRQITTAISNYYFFELLEQLGVFVIQQMLNKYGRKEDNLKLFRARIVYKTRDERLGTTRIK